MLVRFHSSVAGELFMFAPVAHALLDIIGKRSDARGVITAEQLPAAIEALRQAVAAGGALPLACEAPPQLDREGRPETPVSLARRAFPLSELMQRTQRDEGYILWEAAQDF
jgi:hypothetical protein